MRQATFEYLGVAGWLIRRGEDAVLTAPFFTNPRLRELIRPVQPSEEMIDTHIGERMRDVKLVLAGHAHYDHIMDLPAVMPRLHAEAFVLGGPTVCNTLAAAVRCEVIGERWENDAIRVTAIESQHAPHFWKWRFMKGQYLRRLDKPPERPACWREGETLAFLIDFLDGNGKPELRIYYNDTSPSWPHGLPDEAMLSDKPVDVAILAVASFRRQKGYPRAYVERMQPRHVLLGHWENFFRSADLPLKPLRRSEVPAFVRELRPGSWHLPDRHTVITVPY